MSTDHDYIKQYRLDEIMDFTVKQNRDANFTVDPKKTETYPAGNKVGDLVRLHRLCLSRKVTTVLEFGCGYSTQILAHAMLHNQQHHADFVRANLRRNNPFEVHTIDDMPRYLDVLRNRITEPYKARVTLYDSPVQMTVFNGRI